MARCTTTWRRSTRTWSEARGFTLIEMLVAIGVIAIVMALVLPTILSNRRTVEFDQVRTSVNQTLRATNELLAADVRIAGERFGLGLGMSPIEIAVDANGNSELTLRRNLQDALPVCETLSGSDTRIRVADWSDPPVAPQCAVSGQETGPGGTPWPSTLYAYQQFVDDVAGTPAGYVFDPDAGVGEWFPLGVEDPGDDAGNPDELVCVASAGGPHDCQWRDDAAYAPGTSGSLFPYVTLLEEITYRVRDGVLEKVDAASGEVLRIGFGIDAFDVNATLADGSTVDTMGPDASWRDVVSLDLNVTAALAQGGTAVERDLNTRLFPRNVLSR